MRTHLITAAMVLVLALTLAGCASPARTPATTGGSTPETLAPAGEAAGSRLAAGLYDQPDGTVIALGTLEWRDVEGGFWAVIGGSEANGDAGSVVAVVANVKRDDPGYTKLAGRTVQLTGTRVTGVSSRAAGPEVNVTAITELSDTPGPAE